MSEQLKRLEARLTVAGWQVSDRHGGAAEEHVRPITWTLESRRAPVGAVVELHLRVWERWRLDYEDWYEDQLTAVAVRFPAGDGAEPSPEANLVGDEIERGNWRQLVHVLEWFRDPLAGTFWDDPPRADEWQPPSWLGERHGKQAALAQRWPCCSDAQEMLRFVPGKAGDRKLRLIACACARLLARSTHEHNLAAIAAAERYADGLCPRRETKKLCKHSDLAWLAQPEPLASALEVVRLVVEEQPSVGPMRAADVVREVLGDPFRPVALRHEWLRNEGAAVAHLVGAIERDGRYEEMPILADALEDAGCRVTAVLDHCRATVTHARGCWVMDLLLGRG